MKIKEQENNGRGRKSCYAKVTQTWDAKGSRVMYKSDRLMVPARVPVVLGPKGKKS